MSLIDWSITISCAFEFSRFPFDKNTCPFVLRFDDLDISLGHGTHFEGYIGQEDTDGFKIDVKQIETQNLVHEDSLKFADAKIFINVHRQVPKYIYQYYIPCITIVMASSFSFIIPLSAIPGRVALIVTQFLTLTNIFINQMVSLNS